MVRPGVEALVEVLVEVLVERGGYRRTPPPLWVADVRFDFYAVLEGPGDQRHLVIVAAAGDADAVAEVGRRVEGLLLVLERTDSTRPVSLVLAADPEPAARRRLESRCRTLFVDEDADDLEALAARLAPLLPLRLPEPLAGVGSGADYLHEALEPVADEAGAQVLVEAAAGGTEAVRRTWIARLERAAERRPADGEDEP